MRSKALVASHLEDNVPITLLSLRTYYSNPTSTYQERHAFQRPQIVFHEQLWKQAERLVKERLAALSCIWAAAMSCSERYILHIR